MKKIAIMGSTGSIGTQTLDVVREHAEDFEVVALSAGKNIKLLREQLKEFHPKYVSVQDESDLGVLRDEFGDSVTWGYGMDGLSMVTTAPEAEIVVTAIVGMIGIKPTIDAINAGKTIAIANKETMVCAGHIIIPLAKEKNVQILPVDSEHSAIFQSLQGNNENKISKILLTCSGGAFRGMKRDELSKVTLEDALKNPNWSMGKKVTIDSASLVNKGLEVMEAHWLFDVPGEKIEVVVQPESILHSAVEYEDGAIIGQLGVPDMRLPIEYALYYPGRKSLSGDRLDLFKLGTLHFEKPDTDTFRGLPLAYEALHRGGNIPTVFNAANEVAVRAFLDEKISFLDIYSIIEKAMNEVSYIKNPSLSQILETKNETESVINF